MKEICELLGCGDTRVADYSSAKSSASAPAPYKDTRANEETIHQTYSILLAGLSLSECHLELLKSRGMSMADISAGEYRSVPPYGHEKRCQSDLANRALGE